MTFSGRLLLAAVGMLALTAMGETVRFRGGELLRAEISDQAPAVAGLDKDIYDDLPLNPAYAALTLRLDANRELSVYDYVLTAFGNEFPCVALTRGSAPFDVANWKVFSEKGVNYTLLFVVDRNLVGSGNTANFTLKPKPAGGFETPVRFKKIGSRSFGSFSSVPGSGDMTVAP